MGIHVFLRRRVATAAWLVTIYSLGIGVRPGLAQNYSSDVAAIAVGGVGQYPSDAEKIAGAEHPYRDIVLPIGLYQVLKDRTIYNPSNANFNPVRALELAASPLHFTFGRDETNAGDAFVRDLVNGTFNRDLNTYRGFTPQPNLAMAGLLSPHIGKAFHLHGQPGHVIHGLFVGVGPYVSVNTDLNFDQRLLNILASPTPVYVPNTSFLVHNTSWGQAAAAVTGGYRVRIPITRFIGNERDGVYVAVNYNYLLGFRYDTADLAVRFDTDNTGLITLNPTTTPAVINHQYSSHGRGEALDISSAVVLGRWQFRGAAAGIANRIDWQNLKNEQLILTSLLLGLNFQKTSQPSPANTVRVTLPVRYATGATYQTDKWTAATEVAYGLEKLEVRAGGEYRLGRLALRGGGSRVLDLWEPSGGVGVNITKHFGIDGAVFGTATNIEHVRQVTAALALRIQH